MADKKENVWLNLGFNIVVPTILLIKGASFARRMGIQFDGLDTTVFAVALAFPLIYGIADLINRKKFNVFSIIGVLSVALTGGIGLLKLSRECMIIKEGLVPLVLGVAVLLTANTKKPLAKIVMLNDAILNVKKVDEALEKNGTTQKFNVAMKKATLWLAASFLISSALNFALAWYIFKSPAGTEAFNAEVGKMTALSFPVIVLPMTLMLIWVMFKLFNSITKCTGLTIDDLVVQKEKK